MTVNINYMWTEEIGKVVEWEAQTVKPAFIRDKRKNAIQVYPRDPQLDVLKKQRSVCVLWIIRGRMSHVTGVANKTVVQLTPGRTVWLISCLKLQSGCHSPQQTSIIH